MSMMKKILVASMCAATFGVANAQTQPAAPAKPKTTAAAPLTAAQVNALIDQLTKSGKLDAAIDAGVERFAARQQEEMKNKLEDRKRQSALLAKKARKVSPARDHIYGSANAEWSLIVYSDLECSFCKRHSGVPEAVVKAIGVDKINVVFRHLPLPMHGDAAKREAVASECVAKQAGNEGFFKFVNSVLQNSQLNGQGLKQGDADIIRLAREAGVSNEQAFTACMQDVKTQEAVKEDLADGAQAGVDGTPGNIIRNNKTGLSVSAHGSDPAGASALEARVRAVMSAKK
jgi:protein-disulfide isomerase